MPREITVSPRTAEELEAQAQEAEAERLRKRSERYEEAKRLRKAKAKKKVDLDQEAFLRAERRVLAMQQARNTATRTFRNSLLTPPQMTAAELEEAPPSPVHNSGMPDIAEFKEKYGEDTWQPHYYEHYMKTRKKRAAAVQSSPAPNHGLITAPIAG
jgi:hypothetical protein